MDNNEKALQIILNQVDKLEAENARLREALERAERYNAEGINALVRGFVGNAEVDFRDSQKVAIFVKR